MTAEEYRRAADAAYKHVEFDVLAETKDFVEVGAHDPMRFGFDRGFDLGYRAAKAEDAAHWPEQHHAPVTARSVR